MPNYLGIDYGTKVIGLAWADDLGIALPVGTIPGLNVRGCWQDLAWEVEQRKIDQFVVGYPIHMDETIGKRAREVDAFTEQLKKRFGLPVTRVDERLTTLAAAETLGKKAKKRKRYANGRIDAAAACLILKDFLNQLKQQRFPSTERKP